MERKAYTAFRKTGRHIK